MSIQDISQLLQPADVTLSCSKASQHLNDVFTSTNDLDRLDDEFSVLKERQATLDNQLLQSRKELNAFLARSRSSLEQYLTTAQELALLRHSLTDELTFLHQELLSSLHNEEQEPSLLENIETQHRNLKDLESIQAYVLLLRRVLTLRDESMEQIGAFDPTSLLTPDAVSGFRELHAFVGTVEKQCSTVTQCSEPSTLNLLVFLRSIRDASWAQIKQKFFSFLLSVVEPLGWPSAIDFASSTSETQKEFERAFRNLLELQDIRASFWNNEDQDSLYPLQALIQPISLRFKYHFEGTRQTNRLDKPEWYFTHIINVIHEHRALITGPLRRLLDSSRYKNSDAMHQFIALLLPLPQRRLKKTIPALLPHPSLLAHTIYQALSFDSSLKQDGFQSENPAELVSNIILGNDQWFAAWLNGEKNFTEEQYNKIISAPDAWTLAHVDSENESDRFESGITNSARRVKGLIQQVTDRYTLLPSPLQRTQFLTSIQLPILEAYESRIVASLDAFESLSLAFVRAVPGALSVSFSGKEESGVRMDPRPLTAGVEGVQRLCKAFLSASYIEKALSSWGEEIFFLELWIEMNRDDAWRTLSTQLRCLPQPSLSPEGTPQGTVFDEICRSFSSLVKRGREMITQQITSEIEQALKGHFMSVNSSEPQGEGSRDMMIAPTLLGPVALFSSHLNFLKDTLSPTLVTSFYRTIASRLSEHMLQRQILYRGDISLSEGRIILSECNLWLEACHAALAAVVGGKRPRIETPWLRFIQASRLVSVEGDSWDAIVAATIGGSDDGEWAALLVSTTNSEPCELSREEVGRIIRHRRG